MRLYILFQIKQLPVLETECPPVCSCGLSFISDTGNVLAVVEAICFYRLLPRKILENYISNSKVFWLFWADT